MNDSINTLIPWVAASIGATLLLWGAIKFVRNILNNSDQRLIQRLFKKHKQEFKSDFGIPDGIDGMLFVDYLFLIRGNIIALKIIEKNGYIFGANHIDEWTCVDNNRTEKFTNPLKSLQLFTDELKREIGFDRIIGYALFGSQSRFEKGKPEGVLLLKDLETMLSDLAGGDEEYKASHQAWEKLSQLGTAHVH